MNTKFLWHPATIDNGTFSVIEAAHLKVPSLSSGYPAMKEINEQYNLSLLLDNIVTRNQRCAFERVIAVLLQMNSRQPTLLGNIQKYCAWGIQFENKENCRHLPMIKVWTGR